MSCNRHFQRLQISGVEVSRIPSIKHKPENVHSGKANGFKAKAFGLPLDVSSLETIDSEDVFNTVEKCVWILQKCRKKKIVAYAKHAHEHICNNGLEAHKALGNYIVPMLVECGSLPEAQHVFDRLVHRNEHSWTALILGYIQYGQSHHALHLYQKMQQDSVHPSRYTLIALLKACTRLKELKKCREAHFQVMEKGFSTDIVISNTLVDMYAKCGFLTEALEVFQKMPARDVVSWTALIAGYTDFGLGDEALKYLEQMQLNAISPNRITFVCCLKACGRIGAIDKGREIHKKVAQKEFETDPIIGNSLVDMYAKCGSLSEAHEVFDRLPIRDVVSWNALIAGYTEYGSSQEALRCYEQMQLEGAFPDLITFSSVFKACSSIGAIDKGREIHIQMIQKGFQPDLFIGNTLVDMYAKCGSLSEARDVFDKLPVRDVVSWNALIAGYAEDGAGQEALNCFEQMAIEGVSPNAVTFVASLKACGRVGAIDKGREVHAEIKQRGFELDVFIGSMLIDMYARCGSLSEAEEVFDKLPVRKVVLWSAMINGYGMNHEGALAVQCFEGMQEEGVSPDAVTFTCLLTACSRANLVLKGREYFNMMRKNYGIIPTIDHYTCIVDLLSRSGSLLEAEKFLSSMPFPPTIETWMALLNACKAYGKVETGLRCFQHIVHMNPRYAASYVLMENMYANTGKLGDAYKLEEMRRLAGAKKNPANALIEVNKKVHGFVLGENQSFEISSMLESLGLRMELEGYVPNLDLVVKPISDDEKKTTLCEHAEKLALAFGLLNTPPGQTLHVTKNIRMCNNCHNANKVISRIEKRKIIIRDGYCVHHFKDGLCSCGDIF